MTIRAYTSEDYEGIKEILIQGGNFHADWDRRELWTKKIEEEEGSILVAEDETLIVGVIMILRDPWTSFLFRFAVRKSHRRQGIGSALLEAAEIYLKEKNMMEVSLWVSADNEELCEYYEKRGYTRGGVYRSMNKSFESK